MRSWVWAGGLAGLLLASACAAQARAEEWKPFESRKLGIALQVPADWQVSEGDTQVAICQNETFCLNVYAVPNPSALTSLEVFRSIEQKEERGETGGPNYSSLTQVKIGDLDAVTLKDVFAYDTADEETFVAAGTRAYLLDFTTRMTPPYARQEEATAAARKMVGTFRVLPEAQAGKPALAESAPKAP